MAKQHNNSAADDPKIGSTLWNDIRQSDLRHTFCRDLRDIYHFYISKKQKKQLQEMSSLRKIFAVAWWILKGMFFKLSPLWRVMLAVSIYFSLQSTRIVLGRTAVSIDLQMLGYLLLLVILMVELKDKLLARDELAAGRAVQNALTPRSDPHIQGWDIFLFSRPANDVGGDLIDFIETDTMKWALTIGDVAGKGLGAALLMARMIATLRALAPACPSPAELGTAVNSIFCRDGLANIFISLLCLYLSPDSDTVTFFNAGHMPLLKIESGKVKELSKGEPAVGLKKNIIYKNSSVSIAPGAMLLAYSDGVTDSLNSSGTFYGEDTLKTFLASVTRLPSEAAGKQLISELEQFAGTVPQTDDISFMIIKRKSDHT